MSTATMTPLRNNFSLVFAHEARVLNADRTLWWVASLLLALVSYSLYTGLVETRMRDVAAAEAFAAQERAQHSNIEALRKVMAGISPSDPFANAADPASIGGGMGGRYAVMPTAPLAPLAFGQSDMFPNSYKISYRSKVTFMYDSEMENPWNLLSGHLDLSFVIVYLLPLLIFAMSYNLLSVEREHGTLRMLLSQPLKLVTLVLGKVAIRASVVLGIVVAIPIVVLLVAQPQAHASDQLVLLFAWALLVVAYGLFWFALAAVVNALGKTSAVNALVLAASWVLLVLVLPVSLNLAVQDASPAPSRTELATTTRIITIEGLNRYNELLSTDYRYTAQPEMLMPKDGKFEVQPRRRGHYLIQRDVDAKIETVLDRFDEQLAGQQKLVDRYGLFSPAIVMYEGMTALAGTGSKRYQHFQNQVDEFHREWKAFFEPKMEQSLAMTEADLENLPKFAWRETRADGTLTTTITRVLQLLIPALLLIAIAWRRLRIYKPV